MRVFRQLMLLGAVGGLARAQTIETSPLSFRGSPRAFTDTLFVRTRGAPLRQVDAVIEATGSASLLYVIKVGDGGSIDSLWLSRPSLTPIRHVSIAGSQRLDMHYSTDSITGIRRDSAGEHSVAMLRERPAFDFSSLPLVLRYLNARAGDRGVISTFDIDRGIRQLPYSVAADTSAVPGEPPGVVTVTVEFGGWKTSYRIQSERHSYLGYDIQIEGRRAAIGARRAPPEQSACTATGDLEIVPFASKVFSAPRNLRILLPSGYRLPANRNRRYPVLYLNDGQNLFDVCTSMYQREEWRVDETVQDLIARNRIPPLIVVGIDNGGRSARPREYLPWPDETLSPPEPKPQGKQYPRFLLDEVVPFVERRYRVHLGAENRALGGSSYGAGIALYTAVVRPGSFGGLLLESPSVYADDYHLLKDAEAVRQWPRRVFIGVGTVNEPVDDVEKLRALFTRSGLHNDRLRVVSQDGAAHSEKWWAQRLPGALEFLFAPPLP